MTTVEILPHDADAEADLLCTVMTSGGGVLDDLQTAAAEFYRPIHETIYRAALALHLAGKPVEPTTLVDHLQATGDLQRIGGAVYLADLYGRYALPGSARAYAAIIRERAARRAVIQAGMRLQQSGANPTDDPAAVVEAARSALDHLADRISGSIETDQDADLDAALDAIEHGTASLPTPWPDLDHLIGGWRKGAVYVVAARPGGGKSIFGLQAAIHAMVHHGLPTAYASVEMTRTELHQRAYSQLGEVNLSHIMRGGASVGADEWDRIAHARGVMGDTRFEVDDRSSPTIADIRSTVARCVRRHGSCGLLVIDYLQLLTTGGRPESRQVEVATISRAIKVAAKDLNVPIILMSQLNRGPEGEKRAPRASDLRESGAVEQDADVVILLHRDEENDPAILNVGIGKNRHGPKGALKLVWQGHYSRLQHDQWTPGRALRSIQ